MSAYLPWSVYVRHIILEPQISQGQVVAGAISRYLKYCWKPVTAPDTGVEWN